MPISPTLTQFREIGSVYPGLRLHIVAIGFQKPYAKLEKGENLVLKYDVYWLAKLMMVLYNRYTSTGSKYLESFPGSEKRTIIGSKRQSMESQQNETGGMNRTECNANHKCTVQYMIHSRIFWLSSVFFILKKMVGEPSTTYSLEDGGWAQFSSPCTGRGGVIPPPGVPNRS